MGIYKIISNTLTSSLLATTLFTGIVGCGIEPNDKKVIPSPEDEPKKIISEEIKKKIFNIYYKLKYTQAFINELSAEDSVLGLIFPDVDPEWVKTVQTTCNTTLLAQPKYLGRLLFNRNVEIDKKKSDTSCPIKYKQSIEPKINRNGYQVHHHVPTQVQLVIYNSKKVPKYLLKEFNLSGLSKKVTSATSKISGNSQIKEDISGIVYEGGMNNTTLSYTSDIRYEWDRNKTILINAQLSWEIGTDDGVFTIKETYNKSFNTDIVSKLYFNNELIEKTSISF